MIVPADRLLPEDVLTLWEQFADVPIDEEDRIEVPFMGFPAGTNRFDIWHWFDERWPGGVYDLSNHYRCPRL